MKKRLLIGASAVTLLSSGIGLGSAALASAQTSNGTTMPKSAHVRGANHSHHARQEAKLNQAVRDGTITYAQKTAFLSELQSLHAKDKLADPKTNSNTDREAERTKMRSDLTAWATANNFPLEKIAPHTAN